MDFPAADARRVTAPALASEEGWLRGLATAKRGVKAVLRPRRRRGRAADPRCAVTSAR
jgi:hypothetical protein